MAAGGSSVDLVADLKARVRDVEAYCDLLKGALVDEGVEVPGFMGQLASLRPQHRALIGALYRAYPRHVDSWSLLDRIPGLDHAEERQVSLVRVLVHHARRALGHDAVELVRGQGYRLGPRLFLELRAGAPLIPRRV